MKEKKYWKGLEELKEDPDFIAQRDREFAEELPVEELWGSGAWKQPQSRRDFLRLMGFGVSAAAMAASCRIPVKHAIPYVIKPEEVIPGKALWYASTFVDGNDFCPVLVKVRDGRPIKIEPSTTANISAQSPYRFLFGGTSARAQASVLSLYDLTRPHFPTVQGNEVRKENQADVEQELKSKLQQISARGGNIVLVTGTILSPSTQALIRDFLKAFPGSRHVIYDAVSHAALAAAHEKWFGVYAAPGYHFEQAEVIVSLGSDFLGTWLSPTEFARQYVQNRKVSPERTQMSRHYQFEACLSLTGANADERAVLKPSQEAVAAVALYRLLRGEPAPSINARADALLSRAAADLKAHRGRSLVVSGSNDQAVQEIVAAINLMLGNYGSTLRMDLYMRAHQGNDAPVETLLRELKSGAVHALIFYGANPVYDHPRGVEFAEAIPKVELTLSLNDRIDETTVLCTYHFPDHHYLESWNDCSPYHGLYLMTQPVIWPLFRTRQAQETLMMLCGINGDFYSYMQRYWEQNIFPLQSSFTSFQAFWDNAVKEGAVEVRTTAAVRMPEAIDVSGATEAVMAAAQQANGFELYLYEKVGSGNGRYANNPWLMELPDPISKVVWDNYLCISPKLAKELQVEMDVAEQRSDLVSVTLGETTLTLPVFIQPGQEDHTVAVALGYGRTHAGRSGNNVGVNVYPWVTFNGQHRQYHASGVVISKTGKKHELAMTQTHFSFEGRDVIQETTLNRYRNNPHAGKEKKEHLKEIWAQTLYPEHPLPAIRWGMSIDLNSCIGCGACAVSCQAENNVPVVGKTEVRRIHEMTWLRIDRYYSFPSEKGFVTKEEDYDEIVDYQQVQVVFQPMLCQHCDNAPCENVCPVNATNHSSEGLNQMAYNRCIGTRYCANNCPYKVRRFNWLDYTTADVFPWNEPWKIPTLNIEDLQMHDAVTRMVLNPDVTVRTRGVMEKCSFCVQRLQEAKLEAKMQGRPLRDGDARTACQTACPTDAIQFGNLREEGSRVKKDHEDARAYYVLAELNTQPGIAYLKKVRNTTEENISAEQAQPAHG
ncbi:MAG: TAT-variant-translocated molybdopterin oxidoreductase [Chitinophagales bacterium]|nr:TAT-variant-translocated molybdopterin oxidoreductase [Chitinophagales bacterium]MDW8428592.1 TAT-variant-translocated molybdopterin oxidoreductase [Chitinophagales bacterium]